MPLRTLDDLSSSLTGQRVFVRVDFNVPMQGSGEDARVLDDTRIREALPTLRELHQRGARLLLASHRGRPKGERREEFSMRPIAPAVSEALDVPVTFVDDCIGTPVNAALEGAADGSVFLLENLRFHAGEQANDDAFVEQLAAPVDIYVGDAFGTAHRAHASTAGLPARAAQAVAGRLMTRESEVLGTLLSGPEAPYAALLGGAKISGKIDTLARLVEVIDVLLIGGGMANTFLVAQGHALGGSLFEADRLDMARQILERCSERGVQVLLPSDLVVTDDLSADSPTAAVVAAGDNGRITLGSDQLAVDLGPETADAYARAIGNVSTLFWNGPMGVFEKPPFDDGTRAVAAAVGECPGFTVIGGGETVAAAGLADAVPNIDHVSTGGGASLALLAGKDLPGLDALRD